jgi:hypothetical protein
MFPAVVSRASAIVVGGVLSLVLARSAWAAPPAWCKNARVDPPELSRLSSKDTRQVIKTLVSAACAPSQEAEAHRAEIEAARQAWSRRLGMVEADWADAVAYVAADGDRWIEPTLSTDVLAAATPLDQYAIIAGATETSSEIDPIYATDMFDASLSEVGRFAFLDAMCFDKGRRSAPDAAGMLGTEVPWGICQADFERFDLAKLLDELRSDTVHDGALRMKLRIAVLDLPRRIQDHAAEVQQMRKRDDGHRKLFELAASARAEWSSGIGKNPRLLELVLAMESAHRARSRKQLADCGPRTAAALTEAVAALPARAFAEMRDERNNPVAGFASSAGLVLAQSPAVHLAAIAYTLCTPESGISKLLKSSLAAGPPLRGPRNAALARLRSANLAFDKVNAKLSFPSPRPYGESYPAGRLAVASAGGIVRSVKRSGDVLTVEVEKTLDKQQDCLKSRSTGRIARVRPDGSVEYERVCERSGTVIHDHTWTPFQLAGKYAAWLKPGVRFSAIDADVIAIWPSKTAKAPSMVLGAEVK